MSFTSDPEKPFHQLERIQAPHWKWQNKLLASSARCWGDATAYMSACSGHWANFVIGGWETGNERRASIFPHRIVPSLSVRSLVISVSYCWSALLYLSPVYCLITSKQKEPVSYYKKGQYLFIEARTKFHDNASPAGISRHVPAAEITCCTTVRERLDKDQNLTMRLTINIWCWMKRVFGHRPQCRSQKNVAFAH